MRVFQWQCPDCKTPLEYEERLIGQPVECPKCLWPVMPMPMLKNRSLLELARKEPGPIPRKPAYSEDEAFRRFVEALEQAILSCRARAAETVLYGRSKNARSQLHNLFQSVVPELEVLWNEAIGCIQRDIHNKYGNEWLVNPRTRELQELLTQQKWELQEIWDLLPEKQAQELRKKIAENKARLDKPKHYGSRFGKYY